MIENNEEKFLINTSIGELAATIQAGKLVGLSYIESKKQTNTQTARLSPVAKKIRQQIQAYFRDAKVKQTIAIDFTQGTVFQKKVWRELLKIKPGKTLSYGELAKNIDSGPRAVANACRANPIAVIVPCHRVVAQTGIGGYHGKKQGRFINIKKTLLAHEGWSGSV